MPHLADLNRDMQLRGQQYSDDYVHHNHGELVKIIDKSYEEEQEMGG